MSSGDRRADVRALAGARMRAYPPGEFVGQENFMTASEILDLARRAGFTRNRRVLDLCCGIAGPGLHVARSTGARLLGVDADPGAVALARERAAGLPARFVQGHVPDVAVPGDFDGVMLLETILAFRDKRRVLDWIAGRLRPGGTFAFTLEEGEPLDADERIAMPASDTVWLVPLAEMERLLEASGFALRWCEDHTASHLDVVRRLLAAFREDPQAREFEHLLVSHGLWADWMAAGRVRKFAMIAAVDGLPHVG